MKFSDLFLQFQVYGTTEEIEFKTLNIYANCSAIV